MKDKELLEKCLTNLKNQLERICNSPDFSKKFKKYKYELRRITAEVVHRTNNIVGEQKFVTENFKKKFRNESILGLQFGNHLNDFYETKDKLQILLNHIQSDSSTNYEFDKSHEMNLSPSRFAIPIYLITIISVLIFHLLNIPWYYVTFIFVSSALLIALIATIELRNNDKLTEPSFNALFVKVLKSILIFRKIDGNN